MEQIKSCCQEAKVLPLNTIIYILSSIVMICPLFIGIHLQAIPPLPGGLAILLFGAWWHNIGRKVAIKQENTPASCIITAFFFFWLYNGVMLTLIGISEAIKGYAGTEYSLVTKADMYAGLAWIEPGLTVVIAIMMISYWKKKELFWILMGLVFTVGFLWCSKNAFESWHDAVPTVVGALMLGSAIVLIIQLLRHLGIIIPRESKDTPGKAI